MQEATKKQKLVCWPDADVSHYNILVEIGGLKSEDERLRARIENLEKLLGVTAVIED